MSLTEFTASSRLLLPGIMLRGAQLQLGWYGLPGAIGVRLWVDPWLGRVGSVSVWTDRGSLYRWVSLPLHRAIMSRYRSRGTVRSALWESDASDRYSIIRQAARRLADRDFDSP